MTDASLLVGEFRVVPVVVVEDAELAVPLAETLLEAGLGVIEITLRTDSALVAIEHVCRQVPGMLVGAGSVRRPQQFADVASAGARFVVSPGASDALLNAAAENRMPYIPGAATPSEMIQLLEHGYSLQKFFPAESAGGMGMLKSVASPIPEIRFMPTGGITVANAPDYLALPNVQAIGGSWITPAKLVAARDWPAIRQLAAAAAALGV